MTNFEKITETPEALGELLASLTVIDSPWEDAFQKAFCAGCGLENCDVVECPHDAERNNPLWWLVQTAEGGQDPHRTAPLGPGEMAGWNWNRESLSR